MSFDWKTYLELANNLTNWQTGSELEEAALRSAISRAYYGAFISARNFLIDTGLFNISSKNESHRFIIDNYIDSRNSLEKKVGADLKRLKRAREKADYIDDVVINKVEAVSACNVSRQILTNLRKLR